MDKVEKIYNKFQNGDSLTNAELDIGINFFSDLSEKLNKAGPVFQQSTMILGRAIN